MGYIEPAPIKDKENPFESMMSRFKIAAKHLGLNEETYDVLKSPDKQVIINIPITMIIAANRTAKAALCQRESIGSGKVSDFS